MDAIIRNISMSNCYFLLWVLLLVDGVSSDGIDVMVSVTEGDSTTLDGFPGVQNNSQILWKFGNDIIVRVEEAEGIFKMPEDGIFKEKLKLDKATGSLTIKKVTSEHAGHYQLVISNARSLQTKTFSVTVHVSYKPTPDPGLSSAITVSPDWKMIAIVLTVVLMQALQIECCRKQRNK